MCGSSVFSLVENSHHRRARLPCWNLTSVKLSFFFLQFPYLTNCGACALWSFAGSASSPLRPSTNSNVTFFKFPVPVIPQPQNFMLPWNLNGFIIRLCDLELLFYKINSGFCPSKKQITFLPMKWVACLVANYQIFGISFHCWYTDAWCPICFRCLCLPARRKTIKTTG